VAQHRSSGAVVTVSEFGAVYKYSDLLITIMPWEFVFVKNRFFSRFLFPNCHQIVAFFATA